MPLLWQSLAGSGKRRAFWRLCSHHRWPHQGQWLELTGTTVHPEQNILTFEPKGHKLVCSQQFDSIVVFPEVRLQRRGTDEDETEPVPVPDEARDQALPLR
jgi:hypothetical protein